MIVDQNITNDRLNGIYGAIKSGLVHEYFIKEISKVELDSPLPIKCGITYDPKKIPQFVFYINQYFQDVVEKILYQFRD